ncbi:MAG: cell division protein FtsZ [Proteobacteria bacterium]|nr:cell division protein FtsZ [Pseudomonadota bacterium]
MMFVPVKESKGARIKVVGAGGAGGNAINNMMEENFEGVDFIAANTDLQALNSSRAPVKIQLGESIAKGLGAGAEPEIGRDSARESADQIRAALDGCEMVFITAGLGGGTGTGAAPIIAQIAKESGALTVGVVTKPFSFEGNHRAEMARDGLQALKKAADTVITIPNDRLRALAKKDATLIDMFRRADEVLLHSVRGITDLIMKPGLVNLDFRDVRTTMSEAGMALMGIGIGTGENRAVDAAEKALYHPLLEDVSIKGAKALLMNITAGPSLTMDEMTAACDLIYQEVGKDAKIIWGTALDDTVGHELRVTLIATGIEETPARTKTTPQSPIWNRRDNSHSAYNQEARRVVKVEEIQVGGTREERVRDVNAGDNSNVLDLDELDEPTYLRLQRAGAGKKVADITPPVREKNLELPTFLRRKAQ